MSFRISAFIVVSMIVVGCATGPSTHSVKSLQLKPPSLMIARKSPRTLFIVLDPARVPETAGPLKWDLGTPHITDLHEFVRRDLVTAMANYFERVEVVAPGFAFPVQPHVVADVKVDGARPLVVGQFALAEFTWGFALRPSEADDYLFSYAGTSRSEVSRSANAMIQSLLENAITDFVKAFTEKEVHQKLLQLPSHAAPVPGQAI